MDYDLDKADDRIAACRMYVANVRGAYQKWRQIEKQPNVDDAIAKWAHI